MPCWTSSWHGQLVLKSSYGWCCNNHSWLQGACASMIGITPSTSTNCTVSPQEHLTSTHRSSLCLISEARYISQPLLAFLGSGSYQRSRSCIARRDNRGASCSIWSESKVVRWVKLRWRCLLMSLTALAYFSANLSKLPLVERSSFDRLITRWCESLSITRGSHWWVYRPCFENPSGLG